MEQVVKNARALNTKRDTRWQGSMASKMCKKNVSRPDLIYAMIQANEEQKNIIRDNLHSLLVSALFLETKNKKYVSEIAIDLKKYKNEYEYIQKVIVAK